LENFTTEVLVHLFNNDNKFKNIFIRHIIRDGRSRRRFKRTSAESQKRFRNGILDIVLSASGSPVFVEVKLAASETETKTSDKGLVSQVQKYLDFKAGNVAYLTTKAIGAPNLRSESKRFLGQFYFEDLYDHLVKAKLKLTDCGSLFLEFMEENDMKSPEPFTQQELAKAKITFNFAKKCEDSLNEIRSKIEKEFRQLFRTGLTAAHFSPTYGSAYFYSKKLRLGNVKWVEIYIEPENGGLACGVDVKVPDADIEKLNRRLRWKKDDGYLFKAHPVKPDMKTGKCVEAIIRNLNELKSALDRIY
jgi:hypothetical protein